MARPWRILRDGAGSAAWNMAVDEALLAKCRERGPVLRLYRWARPALSLGYAQPEPPWLERLASYLFGIYPPRNTRKTQKIFYLIRHELK